VSPRLGQCSPICKLDSCPPGDDGHFARVPQTRAGGPQFAVVWPMSCHAKPADSSPTGSTGEKDSWSTGGTSTQSGPPDPEQPPRRSRVQQHCEALVGVTLPCKVWPTGGAQGGPAARRPQHHRGECAAPAHKPPDRPPQPRQSSYLAGSSPHCNFDDSDLSDGSVELGVAPTSWTLLRDEEEPSIPIDDLDSSAASRMHAAPPGDVSAECAALAEALQQESQGASLTFSVTTSGSL